MKPLIAQLLGVLLALLALSSCNPNRNEPGRYERVQPMQAQSPTPQISNRANPGVFHQNRGE